MKFYGVSYPYGKDAPERWCFAFDTENARDEWVDRNEEMREPTSEMLASQYAYRHQAPKQDSFTAALSRPGVVLVICIECGGVLLDWEMGLNERHGTTPSDMRCGRCLTH